MIGYTLEHALQQARNFSETHNIPAFIYETITGAYVPQSYRVLADGVPTACLYIKGEVKQELATGEATPA